MKLRSTHYHSLASRPLGLSSNEVVLKRSALQGRKAALLCRHQHLRLEVKRCKVVRDGFLASNQLHRSVGAQQQFFGPQAAVIVKPHGMTVRAGIVNQQMVTLFNLGQQPLDGKLVVVFTERPDDIHFLEVLLWMLSDDCSVISSAIESISSGACSG